MMQALGQQLGQALADKMDFDIFWAMHHSLSNSCILCGRKYKGQTRGWLMRHYRRTGHWRQPNE